MVLSEEKRLEFEKVVKPFMDWLQANCHPHCTAIVDSERAEVLEGLVCVNRSNYGNPA